MDRLGPLPLKSSAFVCCMQGKECFMTAPCNAICVPPEHELEGGLGTPEDLHLI